MILSFLVFILASSCYAEYGEVTFTSNPNNIRYAESAELRRLSELENNFILTLGYTPKEVNTWPEITITSPFDQPIAAVVLGIKEQGQVGEPLIKIEGASYPMREDETFNDFYKNIHKKLLSSSTKETFLKKINAKFLDDKDILPYMKLQTLDLEKDIDYAFLEQTAKLRSLTDFIEKNSPKSKDRLDVVFIEIDGFDALAKEYGESAQLEEARNLLRVAISETSDALNVKYNGRVLTAVFQLVSNTSQQHIRRRRQANDMENDTEDVYVDDSSDFPVFFNIFLFLSIILILAVLAASCAMANMDPGRDSIIYRMTNPRMKKDQ